MKYIITFIQNKGENSILSAKTFKLKNSLGIVKNLKFKLNLHQHTVFLKNNNILSIFILFAKMRNNKKIIASL